jgi:hypothetical protein
MVVSKKPSKFIMEKSMGSLFERVINKLSSSTKVTTTRNKKTGKVSRKVTTKPPKPRPKKRK